MRSPSLLRPFTCTRIWRKATALRECGDIPVLCASIAPQRRRILRGGGDLASQLTSRLLAEMLVEKLGNLAKRDGGLGQAIVEQVLRV